jgi:hypothetical protein
MFILLRRNGLILSRWSRIYSRFTRRGYGCIILRRRTSLLILPFCSRYNMITTSQHTLPSCNRHNMITTTTPFPTSHRNMITTAPNNVIPLPNNNTSHQVPQSNNIQSPTPQWATSAQEVTTPLTNNNTTPLRLAHTHPNHLNHHTCNSHQPIPAPGNPTTTTYKIESLRHNTSTELRGHKITGKFYTSFFHKHGRYTIQKVPH